MAIFLLESRRESTLELLRSNCARGFGDGGVTTDNSGEVVRLRVLPPLGHFCVLLRLNGDLSASPMLDSCLNSGLGALIAHRRSLGWANAAQRCSRSRLLATLN